MIKLNRALCTECQICMIICSWTHFGENTTKRSRVLVDAKWPEIPAIKVCLACPNHECVTACPHDALAWENWIQLDKERCDGCGCLYRGLSGKRCSYGFTDRSATDLRHV